MPKFHYYVTLIFGLYDYLSHMDKMNERNLLQYENSLYLQQHAGNPINWFAWSKEAFEKAKSEDKLMLISIGYSSCHWCHVMEHEIFEDQDAADFLNKHFICIKVDREERPDIDNIYMTAVQLMTQSGGWPLNCVTLPDGRPIFGGTYFPKDSFLKVLGDLLNIYANDRHRVLDYASQLEEGIKSEDFVKSDEDEEFKGTTLHLATLKWAENFDHEEGGVQKAPKFLIPNNYEYLLSYGRFFEDHPTTDFVHFTLGKVLQGGIYDQIEGGLMRYSTDIKWKLPHFEKMLYDNAQFLSLLAKANMDRSTYEYAFYMKQTYNWLETLMKNNEGFYGGSIDADADGEEGAYYVWKKEELEAVLKDNYTFMEQVYQINGDGFWKEGKYILLRRESMVNLIKKTGNSVGDFTNRLTVVNQLLVNARKRRVAPTVDMKVVFSWNCMVAIALIDMAISLNDELYFRQALELTHKLEEKYINEDKIYRIVDDKNKIQGFLDDYAYFVRLCIQLQQYSLDNSWLEKATYWIQKIEATFDKQKDLFYYSRHDRYLITKTVEINDNVIPASNSILANCYWDLGVLFTKEEWLHQARQMLHCVYGSIESYPTGYSNWSVLLQKVIKADLCVEYFSEIEPKDHISQLQRLHDIALFKFDKVQSDKAETYQICHRNHCFLPQQGWNTLVHQIHDILG